MSKPKYNHAFDIAFAIETDHEGEDVTAAELFAGLEARIAALRANPNEIIEACGMPFDTYEIGKG